MVARSVTPVNSYRFQYNGMEIDGIAGGGYTTEFRQYDSRLGRWLSIDPLRNLFGDESPYDCSFNSPIYFSDPSGLGPIWPRSHRAGSGASRNAKRTWPGKGYKTPLGGGHPKKGNSDTQPRRQNQKEEPVESGTEPKYDIQIPDLILDFEMPERANQIHELKPIEIKSPELPKPEKKILPPVPPVVLPPVVHPPDPHNLLPPTPITSTMKMHLRFEANRSPFESDEIAQDILGPIADILKKDRRNQILIAPNTMYGRGEDIPDMWGLLGDSDTSDDLVYNRGLTVRKWLIDHGVQPNQIRLLINGNNFNQPDYDVNGTITHY